LFCLQLFNEFQRKSQTEFKFIENSAFRLILEVLDNQGVFLLFSNIKRRFILEIFDELCTIVDEEFDDFQMALCRSNEERSHFFLRLELVDVCSIFEKKFDDFEMSFLR
jgi:hypothetical protein